MDLSENSKVYAQGLWEVLDDARRDGEHKLGDQEAAAMLFDDPEDFDWLSADRFGNEGLTMIHWMLGWFTCLAHSQNRLPESVLMDYR